MNYYNQIEEEIISNEVYKKVKDYSKNRSDLNTYFNVGKLLSEAGKCYGESVIKEYSIKLSKELNKNYGVRNLYNMRLFYIKFSNFPILHTLCAKLTWSHVREMLNFESNKIHYYLLISYKLNLSVRELRKRIENNEYERLDNRTKEKLITKEANKINDFIKNPILIKNSYNYKKITELKKEHVGQIQTYMNYIDKHVKTIEQNKTIGIIIVKKENSFVMEYCSDNRIFDTIYTLN